jgi:DNA-binding response OmpR family regulator
MNATAISARPILVLEDDAEVAKTITLMLERDGWSTCLATTLAEGFTCLTERDPCIVITDLGLPDGSGMNMVREASSRGRVGVIVVSGRGEEVDRVVGLEVGADDYISKPFSSREVTARVRALYRRLVADAAPESVARPGAAGSDVTAPGVTGVGGAAREVGTPLRVGAVTLDPGRMRVTGPDGTPVRLTGGEADLLMQLIEAGTEALSREAVAERVLGHRLLPQQRGIDQLASSLRQKIEAISDGAIQIIAIRSKGYRLVY